MASHSRFVAAIEKKIIYYARFHPRDNISTACKECVENTRGRIMTRIRATI